MTAAGAAGDDDEKPEGRVTEFSNGGGGEAHGRGAGLKNRMAGPGVGSTADEYVRGYGTEAGEKNRDEPNKKKNKCVRVV